MSRTTIPRTLGGSLLNALGEAVIRAGETARPDRLYADPYAQKFIDAAERDFFNTAAPRAFSAQWEEVRQLAYNMSTYRTLGIRLVEDVLSAAPEAGRRQIVLLGAGLDSHALRLEWPYPVTVFEVDHPELFEFKEKTLTAAGGKARCERRIVSVDHPDEWPDALRDNGFCADSPTQWVDHLYKLGPRSPAWPGVQWITDLSAPGSRYGFPVPDAGQLYRDENPPSEEAEYGLGPGARERIEGLGWATTFEEFADLFGHYGRPLPPGYGRTLPPPYGDGVAAGNVVAIKQDLRDD